MKWIFIIVLLLVLTGCESKTEELNWGDIEKEEYRLLHDSNEYVIYERIEYRYTMISLIQPFSDGCGVVHGNDINYLLYYEGEFHSLIKGIEDYLYTGEELVELGVDGIHCG